MSHHPRLAYVLLAAGSSRRFGSCKQLATIDFKKTLLEHSLERALDVAPGEVNLVLGAYLDEIMETCAIETRFPRVNVVVNSNWQQGVSTSIASGIRKISDEAYDGVLILLADQISITASQLKDMREVWYQQPTRIVAAHYNQILGAPTIFPRQYFSALLELQSDKGAQWLIEQEQQNVTAFALEEAKYDIDTERQLNDWQIDTL
ncbi:nucleotidyltransferase family protein [Agarilytica rhodophyticola]|uniref:nucleotidyltransferase family protein n=1 Tax=Agarilytica rhodophyticola TaxID=1737490 RepID=UPI000B34763E|nr:nucleotidyltransferase family protein [Agarilytica rhodophyticola]